MISVTTGDGVGVVRFFGFPLGWCFHPVSGIWWIGVGGWRAGLKSPRCRPLFSERHGHARHYKIGGGWRVRFWIITSEAENSFGPSPQPRKLP